MNDPLTPGNARILELETKVADLEGRLNFDYLTGAYSRQYMFDQLSLRSLEDTFLIFADMDDFKSVNDHYGHHSGDTLLRAVAQSMMGLIAGDGFVVRLSGDEFIIFVDQGFDDDPRKLVEALRERVRTTCLNIGGLRVSRTVSLGYVRLETGTDVNEAISFADEALIKAKSAGKNQSRRFKREILGRRPPPPPSVESVRQALQNSEIGYHVQPIVRVKDGKVDGFEALLRWSLPSGEIIGPNHFLQTMTSAYDSETRPPLEKARKVSEWAVRRKSKYISFNISEAFVTRIVNEGPGWLDDIVGSVPCNRVVFELLETVLDQSGETVGKAVSILRSRGIRVALDDFGTGHSDLERLQGTDVDYVKIDMRFLHAAVKNARGFDLLASMVDMSHRLGAEAIIEGVEDKEQFSIVRSVGAKLAQGFFLGRPQPIEEFDDL